MFLLDLFCSHCRPGLRWPRNAPVASTLLCWSGVWGTEVVGAQVVVAPVSHLRLLRGSFEESRYPGRRLGPGGRSRPVEHLPLSRSAWSIRGPPYGAWCIHGPLACMPVGRTIRITPSLGVAPVDSSSTKTLAEARLADAAGLSVTSTAEVMPFLAIFLAIWKLGPGVTPGAGPFLQNCTFLAAPELVRFGFVGSRRGTTAVLGNRSFAITRMGNRFLAIARKGRPPSARLGGRIIPTPRWPFRARLTLKG